MAVSNKMKCANCGKSRVIEKNFYMSHSQVYKHNEGRIPICKSCTLERYEQLLLKYENEFKALYHLCMNLDIYYNDDLAAVMRKNLKEKDNDSLAKVYLAKVNSLQQYKGLTSIDSDNIPLDGNVERAIEEVKKTVSDKVRTRWGKGYTDDDYLALEYFFKEYENNLEHENNFMKLEIIKEMCVIKHIRDKSMRDGDFKTAREYSDLLSKKMTDANLKPSQQKNFGEADEDVYSLKMKIIENERPVCEPLKEYLDVDGFWKYLNRHMIKPFASAIGLAKGEYSLEDGSDKIVMDEKLTKELDGISDED